MLASLALLAVSPHAQPLTERQLRARYLVNFVRFSEWPINTFSGPAAPVQVCALGAADPFDGALDELGNVDVGGRRLAIRTAVVASQTAGCHALYVPDSELVRLVAARQNTGGASVLIVGESELVLDRGGMIGLTSIDRRLVFSVNLAASRGASIRLSPQLLRLAREVRE